MSIGPILLRIISIAALAVCMAAPSFGGGSGWVLLSWSPRDRKLVNLWASDHCHTLAGGTPILALDMYEHSYHMDFGAKAAGYVDTFMEAIRWENAHRRFKALANE